MTDINDPRLIELEAIAFAMSNPAHFKFTPENVERHIGHLSRADQGWVLRMAKAFACHQAEFAFNQADGLENLSRLAHASGMPEGGKPVQWLHKRGLIEQAADGGWKFKKPSLKTVQ